MKKPGPLSSRGHFTFPRPQNIFENDFRLVPRLERVDPGDEIEMSSRTQQRVETQFTVALSLISVGLTKFLTTGLKMEVSLRIFLVAHVCMKSLDA